MLNRPPLHENYSVAIIWSVLLHAGIVVMLVFRFYFGSPPLPAAGVDMIEAVIVDAAMLDAMDDRKQQKAETERQRREAERQAAAEKAHAAEQKKQEADRKAAEQKIALQKQREAEKKAAQLKQEQQKQQEAARKAEEKRKQQEALRDEEKRELEAAQQREQEQMRAQAAARLQAEQKELATARELYMLAIQQKVERHWIKPPSAVSGQVCRVVIRQIPGGEVISVQFETSGGDAVFQRSVEQAVYMASPLPDPPDPRVFDRDLRFTFRVP